MTLEEKKELLLDIIEMLSEDLEKMESDLQVNLKVPYYKFMRLINDD